MSLLLLLHPRKVSGGSAIASAGQSSANLRGAAVAAAAAQSAGSGTLQAAGAATAAARITTPYGSGPFFGGSFFGGEYFAPGAAKAIVQFAGASIAAGRLLSTGSGAMVMRAVTPAALASAGVGAFTAEGTAIRAAQISVSGSGTAEFVGEEAAGNVIVAAAAYSAGSSQAMFVSPEVAERDNLIDDWTRYMTKAELAEREIDDDDLIVIAAAVVPYLQRAHSERGTF